MSTESRQPVCQFCVPCDIFAQGPDGKAACIGIFDRIVKPAVVPQMAFVIRWIDGIGKFKQRFRILKPDLSELHDAGELAFELPNRVTPANIIVHVANVQFELPGVHWIELALDGKVVLSFPLPVFGSISLSSEARRPNSG
jgi:hypothetical protein